MNDEVMSRMIFEGADASTCGAPQHHYGHERNPGYTIENRSNEILLLNITISTYVYIFFTQLKIELLPDF